MVTIGRAFEILYEYSATSHNWLSLALSKYVRLAHEGKLAKVDIMDIEQIIDDLRNLLFNLMDLLVSVYAPDLIMHLEYLLDIAKATNNRELQKIVKEDIKSLKEFIERA